MCCSQTCGVPEGECSRNKPSWLESRDEPECLEFCLTESERGGMKGGGLELPLGGGGFTDMETRGEKLPAYSHPWENSNGDVWNPGQWTLANGIWNFDQ